MRPLDQQANLQVGWNSIIHNKTYHMAIFHLEKEPNLTLKLALKSLKFVEYLTKDKEEAMF